MKSEKEIRSRLQMWIDMSNDMGKARPPALDSVIYELKWILEEE